MKAVLFVLVAAASVAVGLVRSYSVEPRSAAESGWTDTVPGHDYVSEVITVAFGLPITASLFCGSPGAGGGYNVSILTYPGGYGIASGDTTNPGDHTWATCTLDVLEPDSFIKGRKVEVRWTRGGSDSIHYYTRDGTTYPYGFMRVGQQDHNSLDLCMRLTA